MRDRRTEKHLTNSRFTDPGTVPPVKISQPNLALLFAENALDRNHRGFARFRDIADNQWLTYSWAEAAWHVVQTALYLQKVGVQKGDRVAIFAQTRYEWVIADLAILTVGAVSTPIYHSLTTTDVGILLYDSEAKVVFAENAEQVQKLEKLLQAPLEVPEIENSPPHQVQLELSAVVAFEKCTSTVLGPRLSQMKDLLAPREPWVEESVQRIRELAASVTREDMACLVYTSGTTGVPKGVMQTHGNHIAMIDGVLPSELLGKGEDIFLYLPLAHSFARLIEYACVATGGNLILPTIVDAQKSRFDAKRVIEDVAAGHPRIFPSVPRLFEKVMEGLTADTSSATKRLVVWAVREYLRLKDVKRDSIMERAKFGIAASLVKKAREKVFGSKLAYCISGGAPISRETIEFFRDIGVTIFEGYGLTETCPAMCANTKAFYRIGSVGRPFECNELRIDEADGEILVRGGNIAKGYWKRPRATAESWDSEGWFRTGDIGEIDEEGYLFITDRKKDLIVLAGGKKIPPAYVEGKLKNSSLISSAVVCGDKKPYLAALLTLNMPAIASQLGGEFSGDPSSSSAIVALVQKAVDEVNAKLASFEQIKKFRILREEFSVENGLLSPSFKVKRRAVLERYHTEVEAMYSQSER